MRWKRLRLAPGALGLLGGLFLGLAAGLLLGHIADPNWLIASGTLALAVFGAGAYLEARLSRREASAARQEQAERRKQREAAVGLAAVEERHRAAKEYEQGLVDEAGQVVVILLGAGGYGGGPVIHGTSLHLDITNGTTRPITQISVGTQPGVTFTTGPVGNAAPSVIAGGGSYRWTRDTEPFDLPEYESSGRQQMLSRTPVVRFTLGGRAWERTGDEPPRRATTPEGPGLRTSNA